MLLTIASVLDAETVTQVRTDADALDWRSGEATAGARAAAVKRNEQAVLSKGPGAALHRQLLAAISTHPVLQAAARPRRISRLLLSRTLDGGGYGRHVDNALMGTGTARIRSDLSFTLFLSEPDTYEGGELEVDTAAATQSAKPAAGDLVLYPSTTIHQVRPVTRGVRLACVGWIESLVPSAEQRELLFDADTVRAQLRARLPDDIPELLELDKLIANLNRLWVRP